MTGGIAHDFRNILAVIDSGLRLAERNIDHPNMARAFIAGSREGVTCGLRLTSQLLTFTRQKERQASAADINALLANFELFLKYGAGSSVRVHFELSPNISKCLIDPSQFAAAILNLVINARDAMPHGGNIEITTAQCKWIPDKDEAAPALSYVRVRVRDDGLGMTEAVRKKSFQPFFTTKGESGTGLGIPQVCAFMQHVGGHLSVESEAGEGTSFDLFFPTIDDEDDLPQPDPIGIK